MTASIDTIDHYERPVWIAAEIRDNNIAIGSFYRSGDVSTTQHIQSGNFVFVEIKFTHIKQLRKSSYIQPNERIGSLSISPTQQWNKQFILHQIRPESWGCNCARVCAIYVCYNKLKCSDLFYIPMWTTYQFWYPFSQWNSTQQQKYSILTKSDTLFWMHLVFVLCNSYVLAQTEVYKSLLYIYWDNISTPTSGMPCIVRKPLRYSIANKSLGA